MTKIVEMILNESELNPTGVFALSLVENAANDVDFIYMSKNQQLVQLAKVEEEKHMIYSPVLIPNKKILRYDEEGMPYFMFFSKDTIEELSINYLKNFHQTSFTYAHTDYVDGVVLVEQWLVSKDNDKSKDLGFDLPEGTWMVGLKVNNLDLWDKVKEGAIKGISIEAYMNEYVIKASTELPSDEDSLCLLLENMLKVE